MGCCGGGGTVVSLVLLVVLLFPGVPGVYFTRTHQRAMLPSTWTPGREFLQLHCLDETAENTNPADAATRYHILPETNLKDLFEIDPVQGTLRTQKTLSAQLQDEEEDEDDEEGDNSEMTFNLIVECSTPSNPDSRVTANVTVLVVSKELWLEEICDPEKMCFHDKEVEETDEEQQVEETNEHAQQLWEVHENSGAVSLGFVGGGSLWSNPSHCSSPSVKRSYTLELKGEAKDKHSGKLGINVTTGELVVLQSLDREEIRGNVLQLQIDCLTRSVSTTPAAAATVPAAAAVLRKQRMSVSLAVRDTNDNAPEIVGISCTFGPKCPLEVDMSGKAPGENLVKRCTVVDKDDGPGLNNYMHNVTLRGNEGGYFKLGSPIVDHYMCSVGVYTIHDIPPPGTVVDVVWEDTTLLTYGSNDTGTAICRIVIKSPAAGANKPQLSYVLEKSSASAAGNINALMDMPTRNSYTKNLSHDRLTEDEELDQKAKQDPENGNVIAIDPGLPASVKQPQRRCDSTCKLILVAVLCGTTLMVVVTAVSWRVRRRQKTTAKDQQDKHVDSAVSLSAVPSDYIDDTDRPSGVLSVPAGDWSPRSANYIKYDAEWEFPRKNLVLDKTLGEGEFGRVLRARANNIAGKTGFSTVAVKMLKECASSSELRDLMSEYNLLKEVTHKNVIKLLGACTKRGGPVYLIVEYCQYGCLRSYLRKCRHPGSSYFGWDSHHGGISRTRQVVNDVISPKDLLSFAWQTASGMQYLSEMKLVHRDLAARNVLLAAGKIVKISDFGLSRDVYEGDTYLKKSKSRVPVKWMAPESLYEGIYTSKSDVWSFGVVLWEIVTLGATPYPGVPVERLYTMVKTGYRMDKPENCSMELFNVMTRCWQSEYFNRPSFKYLGEILERMLRQNVDYLDLGSSIERNPINDDDTLTERSTDDGDDLMSEPSEGNDPEYGSINILLPMDNNDYVMTPHAQYLPGGHVPFEIWSGGKGSAVSIGQQDEIADGDGGGEGGREEEGSYGPGPVSNERSQLLGGCGSAGESAEETDPESSGHRPNTWTDERSINLRSKTEWPNGLNYLAVETVM